MLEETYLRGNLLKITLLTKLLYYFRILPINIPEKEFQSVHKKIPIMDH